MRAGRRPDAARATALAFLLFAGAMAACAQPAEHACGDPFEEARPLAFDPGGWATDFCRHAVPYDEIRSGGPPRDGIPPIDAPRFVPVEAAGAWLADAEPVILVEHAGTAKVYPLQVLVWHEIVNDRVGGRAVAVTFCPLCYAALVFDRPVVEGDTLTFGTTGNLRHSDLVMWDRQTESWWQQFTGEAIVGELTGRRLEALPAPIVGWAVARARRPDARVLSRETGYDRPYGRTPYAGYDDVRRTPLLYDGPVGERLQPMARVVGVPLDGEGRAYALDTLRAHRVVNDRVGTVPLAVFWQAGTASAMDAARIAEGRDVGATGVFRRDGPGRPTLTFAPDGPGRFRDAETGTTWNVLGEALEGPLAGQQLEALPHHDVFWFVWSAFRPSDRLHGTLEPD